MIFFVNNQVHFQTSSAVHNVNTVKKDRVHRSVANLSCFQKSGYYSGMEISSSLSSNLKSFTIKRLTLK